MSKLKEAYMSIENLPKTEKPKVEISANSELLVAAMELFEPPFEFVHGYIYDSANNVVSDDGDIGELQKAVISRVRGWGRLQYLKDGEFTPAQLQDAVGEIIVNALNEYWAKHSGNIAAELGYRDMQLHKVRSLLKSTLEEEDEDNKTVPVVLVELAVDIINDTIGK